MKEIESQTIEKPQAKSTETSQVAALVEEETEKGSDLLVIKTQDRFDQFLDLIERTNQEMIRREKLPLTSQQEMKDIKMDPDQKGWREYWINKLILELDLVPLHVKIIIKRIVKGKEINDEENNALAKYVDKRISTLKFNVEKRLEIAKLKQRLRDIDRQEDYPEAEGKARKTIFYNKDKNELFVYEDKKKKKATFGDIAADYEWGIQYRPDVSVPGNIWRKIRKLSDIGEARSNIEKIFNNELSAIKHLNWCHANLPVEFLEERVAMNTTIGIIAERMAKFFLTRVQYNNDLDFQVESSNLLEDAKLKYDFKITIPEKIRGVAIEGEDMPRDKFAAAKQRIGIQLTISEGNWQRYKKKKKIRIGKKRIGSEEKYLKYIKKSVDDIVLVSLPLTTYKDHFKQWLDNGKPSGGPEQYLTDEEKVRVFKAIMQNFIDLTDEQIQQLAL